MRVFRPLSGPVLEAFGYTCARQNPTVTLLPDTLPLNMLAHGPTIPGGALAVDIWGKNRYFYLIERPQLLLGRPRELVIPLETNASAKSRGVLILYSFSREKSSNSFSALYREDD